MFQGLVQAVPLKRDMTDEAHGQAGNTVEGERLAVLDPLPVDGQRRLGHEPGFEDGLIRARAELNGADFIISRDMQAFRKATIRRLTATEYLDEVCD